MSSVHLELEDDGAPDFAGTVIAILNQTLGLESSLSPNEAAKDIDSIFLQEYNKQGTAGSFLWWFWDLVHDLARQVPYDSPEQDRLAAVVKALHDLPCKTVNLGEQWGSDNSIQVWTKLPMFANTFREKLDDGDPRATSEMKKKERQVNLQAYGARVTGLGLVPFEVYAIWAFVDALEGTMKHIRGARDEVNEDPVAMDDISHKVTSAAAWMIHAGHLLYGRDEEVHGATAGPLWRLDKKEANKLRRKFKGTDGLCPQRWKLWKERFGAIWGADELDEQTRKAARDAYTIMEEIETISRA